MKVYSNLPIKIRKEIILVIDGQPITWEIAYMEIKNNTKLGKKILKKLMEEKTKADYAKCVDISTHAAIKEMIIPGVAAVVVPVIFGFYDKLNTLL